MKISVVTVVRNRERTIGDAIESYRRQDVVGNLQKELIVIDGASPDGTLNIIMKLADKSTKVLSEPDKGLYDALNKGIKISDGDIIGVLHSDDCFFSNDVLSRIGYFFLAHPEIDIVYGDVVYVKNMEESNVVRRHSGKYFNPYMLAFGIMPPHPSMFMRRRVFDLIGYYRVEYKISADFELTSRFCRNLSIHFKYLNIITTKMSFGGISNSGIKSKIKLNSEILDACRQNGISSSVFHIYIKYFIKIFEFIIK